jgi:hypothetical protein
VPGRLLPIIPVAHTPTLRAEQPRRGHEHTRPARFWGRSFGDDLETSSRTWGRRARWWWRRCRARGGARWGSRSEVARAGIRPTASGDDVGDANGSHNGVCLTYRRSAANARPSEAREGSRPQQRPVGQRRAYFNAATACCHGTALGAVERARSSRLSRRACSRKTSSRSMDTPARGQPWRTSSIRARIAVIRLE